MNTTNFIRFVILLSGMNIECDTKRLSDMLTRQIERTSGTDGKDGKKIVHIGFNKIFLFSN